AFILIWAASMKASSERILTTHTGSLPRPDALRMLYVRQSRGESVPADTLASEARQAVADSVLKQRAAGIDIGNDGEQQREAFFLHVRHRMTGFGGQWQRPTRSDLVKYPSFKRMLDGRLAAGNAVTAANLAPPMAICEVRYIEPGITPECEVLAQA